MENQRPEPFDTNDSEEESMRKQQMHAQNENQLAEKHEKEIRELLAKKKKLSKKRKPLEGEISEKDIEERDSI